MVKESFCGVKFNNKVQLYIMKLKTSEIIGVYAILKDAKLTKMESTDKFKVVKMMRPMQGVAEEWDKFMENVDKKLQKENHEEIIEKAKKWNSEGENTTLTNDEKAEINKYLIEFQKEKNECIKEEVEKEHEIEFTKINENAFEKLVDSNDWSVNQILLLESLIKE